MSILGTPCILSKASQNSITKMITVFLVISAPGAFEIEMKHCHFKPAISAPFSLSSELYSMKFLLFDNFLTIQFYNLLIKKVFFCIASYSHMVFVKKSNFQ